MTTKINVCATRVPHMTHEQCIRYAKDDHARLVLATEPVSRYIVAYSQHHVFDAAYGRQATAARYDMVSHIAFRSREDQVAAMSAREYQEIIAPDEPLFSDSGAVVFATVEEESMMLPVAGGSSHRLLHYGKRKEGVGAGELQDGWMAAHAEVVASAPKVFQSVRRAVLNRVQSATEGDAPFDAIGELGFLDRSDVPLIGEYVAMMEERLAPVLDTDRSFFLLTDTVPVRGTLH